MARSVDRQAPRRHWLLDIRIWEVAPSGRFELPTGGLEASIFMSLRSVDTRPRSLWQQMHLGAPRSGCEGVRALAASCSAPRSSVDLCGLGSQPPHAVRSFGLQLHEVSCREQGRHVVRD